MNAYIIGLFIFCLQSMIIFVGAANIPISCNPNDMTQCIYFNENIIGTTTLGTLIAGEFTDSQYKTAQIETDIFNTDIYTATEHVVAKTASILAFLAFGIFQLTRFFLGYTLIATEIAFALQIIAYYFLARMIDAIIKPHKGEI